MADLARPVELLLVEDNEADIRLTQIALKQAKLENTLTVVRDGEEALAYLRREGPYAQRTRPDVVLLDLHLPKLNGSEVLKEIRKMEGFKTMPVIILTSSEADQDIMDSYEQRANCYVTKPADLRRFIGVVEMIENFWTKIVSLPRAEKDD